MIEIAIEGFTIPRFSDFLVREIVKHIDACPSK